MSYRVVRLKTRAQKAQAEELEKRVFGGIPETWKRNDLLFGIIEDGEVVAATRINPTPLKAWKKDSAYLALKKLNPEIAISATAVDPGHRQKGMATALRRHLQNRYSRILAGTGRRSHSSMQHLNKQQGFEPVLKRRTSTQWFWEKKAMRIKTAKDLIPGGKAKGHDPREYDPKVLAKGIKVELEHTSSKAKAREITMDHIEESAKLDPKTGLKTSEYYDELDKMEKRLEKQAEDELSDEERELVERLIREHRFENDEEFHRVMEALGIEPDEAEPVAYQMAHDLAKTSSVSGPFMAGFADELVKLSVSDVARDARVGTGVQAASLPKLKPMRAPQAAQFSMPKFRIKGMPRPFNVNRWMQPTR